jgi:uncharacterized protein (TIGR00725 family)
MQSKLRQRYIAVIGKGDCNPQEAKLAEEVGKELAARGAILVCGGLGGISEAACRGAKNAGGMTIGILPGWDRKDANGFVDHAISTGMGDARNLIIILTADGVIALPGEFGTLSEISFALNYDKPIVSIGSWEISDRIIHAGSPLEAVERIMLEVEQ